MNRARRVLPALLLAAGCAQDVPVASSCACPLPAAYTAAERHRAADELRAAIAAQATTAHGMLQRMLADYAVLRAQSRACAGPEDAQP